jgi:hypothetical protein
MKRLIIVLLCAGLMACGGSTAPKSKGDDAAQVCDAFAKTKLDGKLYQLDLKVLAASMKPNGDTSQLNAPIVIEPGLPTEVKQTLECDVRFNANGTNAEVMNLIFIW